MSVGGFGVGAGGDRESIEEIVRLLLADAPENWSRLHVEFLSSAGHPKSSALLTTRSGVQPIPVSAEVLALIGQHQGRSTAADAPWERLVIDCDADGRLSAHTEAVGSIGGPAGPGRWPRRLLTATTLICLVASAIVFALGWQWSTPPRVGIVAVPAPPPREQAAWAAITKWIDAENLGDVAALRQMVCANPSPLLAALIKTFEDRGNDQRLYQPDTIAKFDDEGARVLVTITNRVRPLSERAKRLAAGDAAAGLYTTDFTLADEDGELKVCDEGGIAH